LLVLLSGILYALVFPKFNLFPLIFVFLIPLFIFVSKNGLKNRKSVFFYSWAAGTLCNIIMLYWIYYPLYLSGAGAIGSTAGVFFLSLYLGIYWALFALFANYLLHSKIRFLLFLIPASWVILEYVKAHLLTGFPWLNAGYSLWRTPGLIQITEITGVYGLSFFVVLINTSLALSVIRKKVNTVVPAAAAFIVIIIFPYFSSDTATGEEPYTVSILQGNISQYEKWDAAYEEMILDTYEKLHKEAIAKGPDIIVWPETSLPGTLNIEPTLKDYIYRLSEKSGAWEIVGSVEKQAGKTYNSAYVVSEGAISAPYRKVHLTPFGEFIPLRSFFSLFISVVGEFGDFNRGTEFNPLKTGEFKVATAICFESIFPYIGRNFFNEGAELYVNITNDGWFLDSAGPKQHFIHSVFRAVENRTYVVRAANTGISGIIAPDGRIIQKTALMEEEVLTGKVFRSKTDTFYSLYGDVFVYLCIIMVFIIMAKSEIRRRKNV